MTLEDLTEEELQHLMEKEDIEAKANGTYEEMRYDEYGIPSNRVIVGEWDGEPIHRKKTLQELHQNHD